MEKVNHDDHDNDTKPGAARGDTPRDADNRSPVPRGSIPTATGENPADQHGEISVGGDRTANARGDELPPAVREVISREVSVEVTRMFSGPIPQASEMAKYKQISPDFPDRILRMSEKNQEANTRALEASVSAESKSILVVSTAYALSVPLFAGVMIAGIVVHSDVATIAGAFASIAALAPQIIKAIRHKN